VPVLVGFQGVKSKENSIFEPPDQAARILYGIPLAVSSGPSPTPLYLDSPATQLRRVLHLGRPPSARGLPLPCANQPLQHTQAHKYINRPPLTFHANPGTRAFPPIPTDGTGVAEALAILGRTPRAQTAWVARGITQ